MKITDKITLTCEDNMEMMSRYPDKYFDLAIVDPPYGIGEAGKNHKSRNTLVRQKDGISMRRCPSNTYKTKNWDDAPPPDQFFNELFRITRNQIIFGGNYFKELVGVPFKPPRRKDFGEFISKYPIGWIIWDKVNGRNDFSDCELIWTSFDRPSFIISYMWAGMMQGKSLSEGNIMQGDKSLNEKRTHPTQKPVKVYKWHLKDYAKPGDRIVDTHFGSGSLGIACHDYGFELTACELDQEYFDKSVKRIREHVSQLTIQL